MKTNLSYNFPVPTKVFFGCGKLNQLATLPMPGKHALIVISNGKSVRQNGALERTLNMLHQREIEATIYDGVAANPTKESVEQGAKVARDNRCDMVVALGGGSVLDAAKVIAMAATNEGDLWQYVQCGSGLRHQPQNTFLPWIAIPTTAGTGSEVDAGGVISNLSTHEKLGIFTSFAEYAIIDPELQLSVPKTFTAYQGFDALFHVMEGHICRSHNMMSDMLQRTAIEHIYESLPTAIQNGQNIEARSRMAFAAMLGGYSMVASTCTAEHSLEHALSAYHPQLAHGAGLIMISKAYYSTIIRQHTVDERFIEMAQWLGIKNATLPEQFIDALATFQKNCGVDSLKMSDYGIHPNEFYDMATNALTVMERLSSQDIQPLTHEEMIHILEESYS